MPLKILLSLLILISFQPMCGSLNLPPWLSILETLPEIQPNPLVSTSSYPISANI